jgi:hypothetical protein
VAGVATSDRSPTLAADQEVGDTWYVTGRSVRRLLVASRGAGALVSRANQALTVPILGEPAIIPRRAEVEERRHVDGRVS